MSAGLGTVLGQRRGDAFVGREAELAALEDVLLPDGPRVVHLSGDAGIGKSSLVNVFSTSAREQGVKVIRIDCRSVEPSTPGVLAALAKATGAGADDLECIAERLAILDKVVLVLDGYELFWLLDTFIRRELCPRLPGSVRVVLAGRHGPVGAWLTAPEWRGLFRSITLGTLTERESLALLQQLGIEGEAGRRVNAIAHGHPLALSVAANLRSGPAPRRPEDAAMGAVMDFVARDYLAEAASTGTKEALEAASVLRRTTESLLRAMLPDRAPGDLMDRLRALPFVEAAADGLFIHDAVRDAVATCLAATDPERHRRYRVAAWHQLRREVVRATPATLWRYTADILYLLQNPLVREGFFPSGYRPLAVEPATPADVDAVRAIAAAQEGAEAAAAVDAWWAFHPQAFRVCRDANGDTVGMFIVVKGSELSEGVIAADPVIEGWAEDMGERNRAGRSLLLRRLLDRREGEANSGSRGAFGIDVKRTYMEMRPGLRYVYLCGVDPMNFDWCDPLGFEEIPALRRTMDGSDYHTFRLDMGPGSVDAWLGRVVADELGIPADEREPPLFDPETGDLLVGGDRVSLTPLERGVMGVLHGRAGRPVSRADLVERVWGYESDATSNVVDAVILTLRRKLGDLAGAIETVRGVGYRYRP